MYERPVIWSRVLCAEFAYNLMFTVQKWLVLQKNWSQFNFFRIISERTNLVAIASVVVALAYTKTDEHATALAKKGNNERPRKARISVSISGVVTALKPVRAEQVRRPEWKQNWTVPHCGSVLPIRLSLRPLGSIHISCLAAREQTSAAQIAKASPLIIWNILFIFGIIFQFYF